MFDRKRSALPFLLPGLIGLFVFYVIPFFGGMYYSFTDGSYQNAFVWFDNYRSVWQNPMFRLGLKNTMFFSAVCTPLVWVLAFLVAMSAAIALNPGALSFAIASFCRISCPPAPYC